MIVSKLTNKIYILLTLIIFLTLISITVNSQNENQSSEGNCTYGTYQCNGQYIQKCDGTQWFDAEYCKTGCTDGKCNEGSYEEPIPETPPEPKPDSPPPPEPPQPSPELFACKHQCETDAKICYDNNANVNNNCINTMYQCQDDCEQSLSPQNPENEFIDYGDAPDPNFPSLKASNGARHINSEYEWLGLDVTKETESRQIDIDGKDDSIITSNLLSGFYTCFQKALPVIVSVKDRNDPNHNYSHKLLYINMLFDWDQSGEWSSGTDCGPGEYFPEHATVNYPINVSSWPPGVTTKIVNIPVKTGGSAINRWIRITLTYGQQVNFPWDGTGVFNYGETEDYGPQNLHEPPENISRSIIYEEESIYEEQSPSETNLLVDGNYNVECQNDYECESNLCIDGTCVENEQRQIEQKKETKFYIIIQSIKNFFKNLF